MGFSSWANAKARKLDWTGIGCVKISVFFFALMIAKLWLPLLSFEWYHYALLFVLAGAKPAYDVFMHK